jgi:DNA-binding CsgD family transcriptional regulator
MSVRLRVDEVRPTFGWGSLSECERQVAELVAQGHSNKEIGRRLYMSHRTVGSHLYRIFPKLGLRSRVQLARLVIERSAAATEPSASQVWPVMMTLSLGQGASYE